MISSTASDDSSLDTEQDAAVHADEPAIAVLAGPGSGKTRTLSFRARHLLARDQDTSALLLTFTNKAAAEMKARALGVAAVPSNRLSASTFHTFCSEVLRAHGELVGIDREFEIVEPAEARAIANAAAIENSVVNLFAKWSASRIRAEKVEDDVRAFGQYYQAAKAVAMVVDFDDLIVLVARLFTERPEVARAFAGKFGHILVDEFQDTNAVQAQIIHHLSAYARSVSIFADDDQAIFGFAGAEAANIDRFVTAAKAESYPLTVNYRSSSAIVEVANRLIRASATASGRYMRAHRSGGEVALSTFETLEDEAEEIGSSIASMLSASVSPSDIAVLTRAGWRAKQIVENLQRRGIPVSDWRGESFAPRDRHLLTACLATVRGRINARQAASLCELLGVAACGTIDTATFMSEHAEQPLIVGLSKMRDLVFQGNSPHRIVRAAQAAMLAHDNELGESLSGVVEAVANFELYDRDFTIEHLLSELALGSVGRAPTQGGGVKIASLHRTKGLQWETVFLIGMEEGHLPDARSSVEEERRLCFVGVSRAEQQLFISFSRTSGSQRRRPSPFLDEMNLL